MLNQDEENVISYCARLVYGRNPRVDFEDYLQEGRLIAIKVKSNYDPNKSRWLTYLRTCVYNGLCRVSNNNPANPNYPFCIVPIDESIPQPQKNLDILLDCLDILTSEEYNSVVGTAIIPKTSREYKNARRRAGEKLKKYGQT